MNSLKVSDVFVPGGLPKYTYVRRADRGLEEHIASAKDNLCKIATVTGPTKSGKTVLVRTVLQSDFPVWIDGGTISSLDDFLSNTADPLEAESSVEVNSEKGTSAEIGATLEAEAGIVVAKAKGKIAPKFTSTANTGKTTSIARSLKNQVSQRLRESRRPLVIDDFHYIKRDLQGEITRFLKPLVFDGVPVIYLAIPHRRYDAVKVEREMNGRIEQIPVPTWELGELAQIAQLGFQLLNVRPHLDTSSRMASESHGSPHLMQEFCRKICNLSGIKETSSTSLSINPAFNYEAIFKQVAHDLGKNIFDKLAKGPRSRSDRLQRKLKSGKSADIYRVTLLALARLRPGVETIEYEPLRASMREILAEDLPQVNEVSRVLEQMAKIAALDESSVAVIDYEKDDRRLHITDPFFAFFLRWGHDLISEI